MIDLFPFNQIEKGSKILLYGLGRCGRTYFAQNEQLKWCNIIYVSDKAKPSEEFQHLYIKPDDIITIIKNIDKVVIAISHPVIVKQVKEWMIKNGILENIIVSTELENNLMPAGSLHKNVKKKEKRKILLIMKGGLGDYVVYLSFYQRLIDYVPDAEIVVQGRTVLLDAIYGQKENTEIISQDLEIKDLDEFDCVLELSHFIKIIWYNAMSLPEKMIKKLKIYADEYEGKYNMHEMIDALFIRRMIIIGRNRYAALGGGEIFRLESIKLKIEYAEYAKSIYERYHLKHYVTFNYGSDRVKKVTDEQLKVWPKELYVEWIDKFKKEYPNLEVVQIGAEDTTKIEGADKYILGEQFEVVKYILKNAIFHLDCEGGLVHLATAIGTKCIVLFGPTPLEYYAYPQNVNLCTKICEGCMGLSENWYYECINNNKQCCMYSITPAIVMKSIKNMSLVVNYYDK